MWEELDKAKLDYKIAYITRWIIPTRNIGILINLCDFLTSLEKKLNAVIREAQDAGDGGGAGK